MILADKIIDLRKKNGWSQEELAEKLGVSRQSVSKWEGAQSVPDMGRVVQLSELFGVSTDYLLKDSLEAPAPAEDDPGDSPARTLGMEEANAFLRVKEQNARQVALGVLLCILSPIWVILFCGGQELGKVPLSEAQAAGLGVTALLLMVGGAVALFVLSALRVSRYEWMEQMPVDTLYGVDGMARERMERFRPTRNRPQRHPLGRLPDAAGGGGLPPSGQGGFPESRPLQRHLLGPGDGGLPGLGLPGQCLGPLLDRLAGGRRGLRRHLRHLPRPGAGSVRAWRFAP